MQQKTTDVLFKMALVFFLANRAMVKETNAQGMWRPCIYIVCSSKQLVFGESLYMSGILKTGVCLERLFHMCSSGLSFSVLVSCCLPISTLAKLNRDQPRY